jgi:hypothetical protein
MKNVALRCSLLAVLVSLAGSACDQAPDPDGGPPPVNSMVVESHQQELGLVPDTCFEVSRTTILPAGPGHPINLCKIDYVCLNWDANGGIFLTNKSLFRPC